MREVVSDTSSGLLSLAKPLQEEALVLEIVLKLPLERDLRHVKVLGSDWKVRPRRSTLAMHL